MQYYFCSALFHTSAKEDTSPDMAVFVGVRLKYVDHQLENRCIKTQESAAGACSIREEAALLIWNADQRLLLGFRRSGEMRCCCFAE
jgi:hypothetical protein